MLWHALYQPNLMARPLSGKEPKTFLFKKREEVINICDVTVTKTIAEASLTSFIQDMKQAYQKVISYDPDAISMVGDNGLYRDKIWVFRWDINLAFIAKFIIKHPHLGSRLTREHLEDLLTVSAYSQSVARTMVETVFLEETQLPALQTPVDETFFKLVAASLTRNDYKHMLWTQDNPSVPIAYVRKRFKEKRLIQNGIIDKQYPLQDLIKLAYQDGRIALMLFVVPELTQVVPINTLFDLALQDLQAGEQHWARPSFDRSNSDHYLQKCPKDSPVITLYFSYLVWSLVFSQPICARFIKHLHEVRYIKIYEPPADWEGGFRLYLIQFKWAHVTRGLMTFRLPLSKPGYCKLHQLWQPILLDIPTQKASLANQRPTSAGKQLASLNTQLPREPAVNVIPPKTVSPEEPAIPAEKPKKSLTINELQEQDESTVGITAEEPSILDKPLQQRVPDSPAPPFEIRTNVLDTDINTASHNVSSTSWGTIAFWVLSAVLTTAGVGLIVLSTILSATYMMPLMVGGFISLASGLVLGLKLLARPKSTYEVGLNVDNDEAIRPTLDTERCLHQEAIVYEALDLSQVSRHQQLPVKHLMQHALHLSASTEEPLVLSHAV